MNYFCLYPLNLNLDGDAPPAIPADQLIVETFLLRVAEEFEMNVFVSGLSKSAAGALTSSMEVWPLFTLPLAVEVVIVARVTLRLFSS